MAKAIKHTVKNHRVNDSRGEFKTAKTLGKSSKARLKAGKKHNKVQIATGANRPYSTPKENIIEATQEIADLVHDLKRLEELKKQLLFKEDAIKSKVMNYMQDHSLLKQGDCLLVTWKSQTRNIFDLPAFKAECPPLYESFLKESRIRVFRLV